MRIDGTNIFMTRGDSESITVSCPDRPFVTGDQIEMTVRPLAGIGAVLIYKSVSEFTDGKAVIILAPSDTANMPFGVVSYDVQATFADGAVKTIIEPACFEIGRENTYGE